MPPKKDKKEKKSEEEGDKKGVGMSEVEKVFLEQQLADSNRKVTRLKLAVEEYEIRNDELLKAYDKLDEDRADIIAYLKKTLNMKSDENLELKEKVKGLEELREIESAEFKSTVAQLDKDFNMMKDQLTAENKLLAGKLNTLEEFRGMRDDLMKKFEDQEQEFKDLEIKYKTIIYDAEKKFVVGKDQLKKEMEARLLQLAQDFQDASEMRIAASTHRVIRENIAINHEIDSILASKVKLSNQNVKLRESEKSAQLSKEIAEEERNRAIEKNIVQAKLINKLKTVYKEILKEKGVFEKKSFDFAGMEENLRRVTNENEKLLSKIRILEQHLQAKLNDQNKVTAEVTKVISESKRLKTIITEAAITVQATLKIDRFITTSPETDRLDRKPLLSKLLDILTQYHEIQKADFQDTITSSVRIYEEGDLGFIPKSLDAMKKSEPFQMPVKLLSSNEVLDKEASDFTDSLPGSHEKKSSIDVSPPLVMHLEPEERSIIDSSRNKESSLVVVAHKGESESDTAVKKLEQTECANQRYEMEVNKDFCQAEAKTSEALYTEDQSQDDVPFEKAKDYSHKDISSDDEKTDEGTNTESKVKE